MADGLSYATTGKGPTDHVISHLSEQDCALYRSLTGEPVCTDAEKRPTGGKAEDGAGAAFSHQPEG